MPNLNRLYDLAYKFWKDRDWRRFLEYNEIPVTHPGKGKCPVHLIYPGDRLKIPRELLEEKADHPPET